ncbi:MULTISPECIES: Imm74 family immunity protein [unclassified Brenneria]|uniref:Imm74 family immunity protein n=1 Tax=unclassified Brenneria TaxID=2634434 RepID=UPI0029C1600F|nr:MULTISPECIES: Imm74 family immunity protein [unclassified Brenneria]MDX5631001.1 Imm74 family immunity protein [Brenneria sp. L3-3Z]MDX5698082.1 Imm74 family immunity protein [Brenneria sp. L4-2C]
MKIIGTNSYIILDDDGKKIKVEGEMVIGEFIVNVKSMKNFEPPYEKEELTEEVKKEYIDKTIQKQQEHIWKSSLNDLYSLIKRDPALPGHCQPTKLHGN